MKKSPMYRRLGKRIRRARLNAGFTQKQIGVVIGRSPGTVSTIESGKTYVYLHHVQLIALYCGVKPKTLTKGIW